ncbi:MAG TPA: adenylate kinase [Bacteroidales bacterium]|jgi:adenylate kinase|nr:adenylate kinase [Bacteroidales bacterium]HPT52316.1 adenylate kinase [Bacteroidales bacterium]
MEKKFNIVLLGAPGSGKGTQAQKITEKYGLKHVSTGELFRKEISLQNELGLKAQSYIDRGELCPDILTIEMLHHYLDLFPEAKGYILDGVPRTIKQAQLLDGVGYPKNIPVDLIIYLSVNQLEIVARMIKRAEIEKRSDDTPEVIKNRINNYFAQTKPLESYYQKSKIYKVNGMNDAETVFTDICHIIDQFIK